MMGSMIAVLLTAHFVADFLLQSREMGKKKSSELSWLLKHLAIQFVVIFLASLLYIKAIDALTLAAINALIHGVIDWNIWRLYKLSAHWRLEKDISMAYMLRYLHTGKHDPKWRQDLYNEKAAAWQYWEDHLFYATIGFDQLLHTLTLIYLVGLSI